MRLGFSPVHAPELYICPVNSRDLSGARHGLSTLPRVTQAASVWPHTGLDSRGGLAGSDTGIIAWKRGMGSWAAGWEHD